ncbi:MAG: NAD(P)/FAD-dependent oxidoreductase [Candidatus Moranbacteria bacterium]|nr:NAD(P)/FAD-dependent oxidoreductase [Candidatus Moranbacteria bacterium]
MEAKKRVAIIGGGFAGLSTAYHLGKAGVQVTLFERENTLGGLAGGFSLLGMPLEKAYHFFYKGDHHLLGLAKELGIGEKAAFYKSSTGTYYGGKLYPFMTAKDLLTFTPLPFLDRIRFGVSALYLQFLKNWEPLSRVTAYEWLKRVAGAKVTEVIWEPLLRGKFNKYYKDIAMSWLWRRIQIRAVSKDKEGEMLGYFHGGFMTIVDALALKIKSFDGTIITGQGIDRIEKSETGAVLVVNGKREQFDAIVATLPSPAFARLIAGNTGVTEAYTKQLQSIDYLGAVVMVFATDQLISPYFWHNINDSKIPFLVLLSTSALTGTEAFHGKHIYYIGAYVPAEHRYFSESAETIMREWKDGLKTMFPDFDERHILEEQLFRFKDAQHIVGTDYREKIPAYQSPIPSVYLSNFSQIFPDDRGTNYAIEEGKKIATMVLSQLN